MPVAWRALEKLEPVIGLGVGAIPHSHIFHPFSLNALACLPGLVGSAEHFDPMKASFRGALTELALGKSGARNLTRAVSAPTPQIS